MDIVEQSRGKRNGYLAAEVSEYAKVPHEILLLKPKEKSEIRSRARESVNRFSEEEFSKKFLLAVGLLFR